MQQEVRTGLGHGGITCVNFLVLIWLSELGPSVNIVSAIQIV